MAGIDSFAVSMLHMDGANASTVFTDEKGKAWTANGGAHIDTAQSVFGGASGYFGGASKYITTPNSGDFDLGTADWTVDYRLRTDGTPGDNNGIISASGVIGVGWAFAIDANRILKFSSSASGAWNNEVYSSGTVSDSTWTHIAFVRYGNTLTCYLNGTSSGTRNVTGYNYASAGLGMAMGRNHVNADNYYMKGWLDEVRVSKGIARWTGNFTPPTSAYSLATGFIPQMGVY